jgi:phosphohistidine phosphatase
MMTIYLLRHAIAVPRGTEEYPGDDRPLTPEGVAKMEKNAAGMLGLGLEFDAIIHSPLSRARDTARIVRKAMKPGCPVSSSDALLPDADPAGILAELSGDERRNSVLLVGHEPHLGLLGAGLLGSRDPSVILRKGGLARIDADEPAHGAGRLIWMLTPRQLRMIGEAR